MGPSHPSGQTQHRDGRLSCALGAPFLAPPQAHRCRRHRKRANAGAAVGAPMLAPRQLSVA
eukprot:11533619-Heterocapsa_arctica.AAC.1